MKKQAISILAIMTVMLSSCKKEEVVKPNFVINDAKQSDASATKTADPNAKYATMDFDKMSYDFGTIKEGEKVETAFVFTNNGETDLLITRAQGTCGCTVPDYPKTPIKPGEKATMTVSFNSAGKAGMNNKAVRISANTKTGTEMLSIKVNVTPDPSKPVKTKTQTLQ